MVNIYLTYNMIILITNEKIIFTIKDDQGHPE